MKAAHSLILPLLFAAFTPISIAAISGSDDFNDNSKNASKWGADDNQGTAGLLTEASQHLEYTCASATGQSLCFRPWILNAANYSTSFEIIVDLTNTRSFTSGTKNSGVGVIIFPVDPFVQSYLAGMTASRYNSVAFKGFIASRAEDADGLNDVQIPNATTVGALRMVYNATTKVFHSYYDADGAANGYSWTEYASMGVNGSGGAQNVNWGLSGTAPFQLAIYGISEGTTITSSQVFADNFSAAATVVPETQIVRVGKGIAYVQTGPSTVAVDPQPVDALYGGPYGFSADVEGLHMDLLSAPTITPPVGTPNTGGAPFYNTLYYDAGSASWLYGPNANDWGATAQSVIDAMFPSGTYTFSVGGISVPLSLTGNTYPNTPQLTLSGGTWVNGKYAMDAANALTITTNVFSQYNSNVDGHIGLCVNGDGTETFASASPATNSASRTMAAATLPNNQVTQIEAGFDVVVASSNALAPAKALAYYGKFLTVAVYILPKITSQTAGQTLAYGSNLTLQVTATGTPVAGSATGLNYQWRKDGTLLGGQTASSLALSNFQAANAGSYTCTVSNDVGSVTSPPIVIADAYQSFATGYGLDPLTTGAPGYDFDHDGISNLLEFVLGGNPKVAGTSILPKLDSPHVSGQNLVFRYNRKLAAAGVTQTVEFTANLASPWTTAVHGQNGVTIVTSPVDAATEQVIVTIPSTGRTGFVRLKVVR
ncbi:MAG: immunoglobulin domain-containing protein [Verrucomicrobiota bacterium]